MMADQTEIETHNQAQELREPLTNILGLIALLEQEPEDPLKIEVIRLLNISAQSLDNATRAVINRKLTSIDSNPLSDV